MKVRIKDRPTGYISLNGGPLNVWPEVGAVVDLPDMVAEDMIDSGRAEKVRLAKAEPIAEVETRPAPAAAEEQRRPTPKPAAPRKGD